MKLYFPGSIPQKAGSMDTSKPPKQKQFSKFWGAFS